MDNAENRVLVSGLELEETQVKQSERERGEAVRNMLGLVVVSLCF